jgi:hypothetical protein
VIHVEDAQSLKGHIYAAQLPEPGYRLSPAASITPGPGEPENGYNPTRRRLFIVHAVAANRRAAMAMLFELEGMLRSPGGPFTDPRPDHEGDFPRRGFIGAPPRQIVDSSGAATTIWADYTPRTIMRVIEVEIVSPAQEVSIEASPSGTGAGEGAAQMTIAVRYVPIEVPAPLRACEIWHDGSDGVGSAEVGVSSLGVMRLVTAANAASARTTTLITLADFASVEALKTAVHALPGWTINTPIDITVNASERLATDLETFAPIGALLEANKRVLRVWA